LARILLNKSNFFHNLKIIEKLVGDKNKIAIVLKDNAYGHGLLEIAKISNEFGIKKAVVRYLYEAKQIENFFDDILVLSDINQTTYSHAFHITINSLQDIEKIPSNTKVHLKVDTGMHRNGISQNELEEAIDGICRKKLILTGVFTHHRSADKLSSEYFWQKSQFMGLKKEVKKLCEKLFLPLPSFHSTNSAALFRDNNFDDDFTRIGIAAYGYIDNEKPLKIPKLKPVLSLWSNKISTRTLKKGQRIGYGGTYMAKQDMTVSTYDLGYGDGFFRINENQDFATPDGYELLGRVSMDNISLHTDKDEVCIFKDVKYLASLHNTISYEILTSLSPTLQRKIV